MLPNDYGLKNNSPIMHYDVKMTATHKIAIRLYIQLIRVRARFIAWRAHKRKKNQNITLFCETKRIICVLSFIIEINIRIDVALVWLVCPTCGQG